MSSTKAKVRKDGDDHYGQFSDPAFKKLSQMNGVVNKMTKDELKEKLEELRLDGKGVKEVLKKRLKNYYKKRVLNRVSQPSAYSNIPDYDFYLVIDFEATCEEHNPPDYQHEIIEFPIVLIDAVQMKVVGEFHSYVCPVSQPRLSTFCTTLTGITQSQVDAAPKFPQVLSAVSTWLADHGLGEPGRDFAVITDGPWDMTRFMHIQCFLSGVEFPRWGLKWVNLRKAYCNFYSCRRVRLMEMLEQQGIPHEGALHSGRDDARNIANIALKMLQDGAKLRVNERLTLHPASPSADTGPAMLTVMVKPVTNAQNKRLSMRNLNSAHASKENASSKPAPDKPVALVEDRPHKSSLDHEDKENGEEDGAWNTVKSKKEARVEKKLQQDSSEDEDDDEDLLYYYHLQNNSAGAKLKFKYDFGGSRS